MKSFCTVVFILFFAYSSRAQSPFSNFPSDLDKIYASAVDRLQYDNLIEPVNGLKLSVKEISKVEKYRKKLPSILYLELEFNNQDELNQLVNALKEFINLKTVQFNGPFYWRESSVEQMVLPEAISTNKQIEAVKFYGKVNFDLPTALTTLSKLDNLKRLIFEYSKLKTIPVELLQIKKLETLELSSSIKELPQWFFRLDNLRSLKLVFDSLNYNQGFGILSKLKNLNFLRLDYPVVKYNILTGLKNSKLEHVQIFSADLTDANSFFQAISASKNLKTLDIRDAKFDKMPASISKFKNLEVFKIYSNEAIEMSDEIGDLIKLRLLSISTNMSTIPITIGKLSNLDSLCLNYNNFSEIPDELGRLKKLRFLDLSSNKLKLLNSKIVDCTALQHLWLNANPLVQLPATIGSLKNLTVLEAQYCNLQSIPSTISGLTKLESLNLNDNLISDFPEGLVSLKSLNVLNFGHNQIYTLPSTIGNLEHLNVLLLGSNNIKILPKSIGKLNALKKLDLSFNDLDSLPHEMEDLSALEEVYLSTSTIDEARKKGSAREIYRKEDPNPKRTISVNHLKNFPRNLSKWGNLKKIFLNNNTDINSVQVFEGLFSSPSKAYIVELENCGIQELPVAGWNNFFASDLNLSGNKISIVPENIKSAPYLYKINLNRNKLKTQPVNLNQYIHSKYEKQLWFIDLGIINENDLSKTDSMVLALVNKSNNHYYRKEFNRSVDLANKAMKINENLTLSKIFMNNLGEASYEIGEYDKAIIYLTKAIQRDTAGGVRIMNFVIPDFEFRAKSYLKLKDTVSAIKDYETLAQNFSDSWGDVGLLYRTIGNNVAADDALEKGIKKYEDQISYAKKSKQAAEMLQLSLLELMIVKEDFKNAEKYSDELGKEFNDNAHKTLLGYLKACSQIGSGSFDYNSLPKLYRAIALNKKSITGWGYELFFKWLRITKIPKEKVISMREITDRIKP